MQNAKIDNYLKLLLNQPLLAIGRASNMLWVGFGKEIECTNFRGQKVKKSSIALHVQSSWRIIDTKRKEIIVAQSDFYFPNRLSFAENRVPAGYFQSNIYLFLVQQFRDFP